MGLSLQLFGGCGFESTFFGGRRVWVSVHIFGF